MPILLKLQNFYALLILTLLIVGLSACRSLVPATTPPQLDHTPGIPITITEDTIITPDFSLNYPDGWRVVKTSIAGAPLSFAFASPDDAIVITLTSEGCSNPEMLPTPDARMTIRDMCVALSMTTIHLTGEARLEQDIDLLQAMEQIERSLLGSVEPSTP